MSDLWLSVAGHAGEWGEWVPWPRGSETHLSGLGVTLGWDEVYEGVGLG